MHRIEVNVQTGEIRQIELTTEEISALQEQARMAETALEGASSATTGVPA